HRSRKRGMLRDDAFRDTASRCNVATMQGTIEMNNTQFARWTRRLAPLFLLGCTLPAWSASDDTAVERGPLAYITRFDGGGISVIDTSTEQEIATLPAQSPE